MATVGITIALSLAACEEKSAKEDWWMNPNDGWWIIKNDETNIAKKWCQLADGKIYMESPIAQVKFLQDEHQSNILIINNGNEVGIASSMFPDEKIFLTNYFYRNEKACQIGLASGRFDEGH
jgi:hypothetical protein